MRGTSTKIDSFICLRSHNWNYEAIEQHLNQDLKHRILRKTFSIMGGQDRYVWKYSYDGEYSVKTVYLVIMDEHNHSGAHRLPGKVWNKLWSLKISFKLIVFPWKLCNNCLPVRS